MEVISAALVWLIQRYLEGALDTSITLLEVHKLMYFMQEAGEPLRLRYEKAAYGPYANNLHHVLHAVEGHLISGYVDGGNALDKEIQLIPGALEDAEAFLENRSATRANLGKVADLVEGFETPFGLELLSTVHWVMRHDNPSSVEQVITQTYPWNERKSRFSRRQIELALHVLVDKDWITNVGF